jgi:uncharacterized protein (DUF2235 family)
MIGLRCAMWVTPLGSGGRPPTKEQHCLAWYKYILYAFAHGGIPVAGVEEFLWLAWVDWNGKRPHRAIGEIDNWLAPTRRGGSGRIVTQAGAGSTSLQIGCRSYADRMQIRSSCHKSPFLHICDFLPVEMASNTPQSHWGPELYPVQSYTTSHDDVTIMSSDPEETGPIPTAIRALQDSRNAHSAGRTLVICLDGTGDKFDNDNSNVVNFVSCLKKDSASQITYYQSGIGTYDGHGMSRGFSAAVDMAVGSGLGVHIKDAYRFIMQYYQEGDKICLLGFSRGSYTVRCLAGMLHKVGLLAAGNDAQIPFAYQFYKDDTPEGSKLSAEFKQTFCTDVTVYFVGVWDCVASVGFIPRILPFSKSPTNTMSYFRHAMSLDEHRAKFKCCQWQQTGKKSAARVLAATSKAETQLPSSTFDRVIKTRTKAEQELIEKKAAAASKLSKDREEKLLELQFEREDHTIVKLTSTDVLEVCKSIENFHWNSRKTSRTASVFPFGTIKNYC